MHSTEQLVDWFFHDGYGNSTQNHLFDINDVAIDDYASMSLSIFSIIIELLYFPWKQFSEFVMYVQGYISIAHLCSQGCAIGQLTIQDIAL